MNKILIITNPAGGLFGKYIGRKEEHHREWVDVQKIKSIFIEQGYEPIVTSSSDINLNENYAGYYVIYASSETRGGFYKEHIENILLFLEMNGAILIPTLPFFRAHHNKSFQEMIRKKFADENLRYPFSMVIDEYNSIFKYLKFIQYPVILKMSRGSGSEGVVKVSNEKQLLKYAKRMMIIHYKDFHDPKRFEVSNLKIVWILKEGIKRILGLSPTPLQKDVIYCNTLVIQSFLEDLAGDYKVLFFADHYYVLYRVNRENDFRASGSGNFVFPDSIDEIEDVLNFAEKVALEIGMPCISMDIARGNNRCALIEFQCVFFGNYTMQYSERYYMHENNRWKQCESMYEIEDEYCRAINQYIISKENI